MSTREMAVKLRHSFSGARRETLLSGGAALYGMLLSGITMMGVYAPFGGAVVALTGKRGIFAFVGALCGYMLFYTPNSLLYGAALLIGFGLSRLLAIRGRRIAEKSAPWVASVATFLCGIPRVIGTDNLSYEVLALVCQSITVAATALLLLRVDACTDMGHALPQERILFAAAIGLGLCGLSGLLPGRFDPVHLLIGGTVLWAGLHGGVAAGGVLGGVCGGMLSLMEETPFLLFPLCLGGVLSGLLFKRGKAYAVTVYLVCLAGSLSLCGVEDKTLIYTLELLGGCVLLLLLPESLLNRLGHLAFPGEETEESDRRISRQLLQAGKGLTDAADCIVAVSDRIRKVNGDDPAWVCESASEAVCSRCGLKNHCWNGDYSATMDRLSSTLPLLQRFGRLHATDLPTDFTADCPRASEMAVALSRFYGEYTLKRSTDDYAFRMRGLLAEQFRGLGNIVTDLSGELSRGVTRDRVAARRLLDVFTGECLRITRCDCFLDNRGRMTVETEGDGELLGLNMNRFLPRMEEALGRRLNKPVVISRGETVRLDFREKAEYMLETAVAESAANGGKVSGDRQTVFEHDGSCLCLISDGMGSGSGAAVESRMTVSLLKRLIGAGFSCESAIHTVNWALMVKGGEERLSTVDLLSVDLYTGNSMLWKAGAAPSFLLHGGEVKELSFPSMPIGILNEVQEESRSLRLQEGDILVMVSDGALQEDSDWLRRELMSSSHDLDDLAVSLLRRAKARQPTGEEDDITVLCARLCRKG